jgi:hypothetical protein
MPCYSGPPETAGVGLCVQGTATCLADGSGFGPCSGEVTPAQETCGSPADEDCDGLANEEGPDCACAPGSQQSCYSGPPDTLSVGPCTAGVQQCNAVGTGYGPCIGEVTPVPETCNTAADDDCDGATNESGAGCVCTPGMAESCYTGPAGTQGVGVCKTGMHVCDPSGAQWGPCTGEVTPTQDLCGTVMDEDCNGAAMPCVGAATWSKIFATMSAPDEWVGLAADGAGNVIVGLKVGNTIDLGGGPLNGFVLAKLDAAGNHLWSKGLSASGARDMAVDANGNVVITGYFNNVIDLGGGVLFSQGMANDLFVAKYNAAGQHLWSKRFGGNGNDEGESITTDADGNLIITGNIGNQADFGGGQVPFAGSSDYFVLKLDPNGNHVWSKSYGDMSTQLGIRVATDPSKNILLAGGIFGSADFGCGALVASPGGTDAFVAKLTAAGSCVWSKRFGDNPSQYAHAVAADSAGNVLLVGQFIGTVDFGGGPLFSGAENDGFVVKLDPSGTYQWAKHATGASHQGVYDVAIGVGNSVVVTGWFEVTVDFGLGSMVSAGATDMVAARLAPDGTALWQKRFGDAGSQVGYRVAVDSADAVILGGVTSSGAIDFGNGSLSSSDSSGDAVIGKLAP